MKSRKNARQKAIENERQKALENERQIERQQIFESEFPFANVNNFNYGLFIIVGKIKRREIFRVA